MGIPASKAVNGHVSGHVSPLPCSRPAASGIHTGPLNKRWEIHGALFFQKFAHSDDLSWKKCLLSAFWFVSHTQFMFSICWKWTPVVPVHLRTSVWTLWVICKLCMYVQCLEWCHRHCSALFHDCIIRMVYHRQRKTAKIYTAFRRHFQTSVKISKIEITLIFPSWLWNKLQFLCSLFTYMLLYLHKSVYKLLYFSIYVCALSCH